MHLLLRLLALLLVLTTGSVFQTLAFASEGAVGCEDDEAGRPCADCAADCALCLCCPLRAAPNPPMLEVPVPVPAPLLEPVRWSVAGSAPSGVSADIFQPPRA